MPQACGVKTFMAPGGPGLKYAGFSGRAGSVFHIPACVADLQVLHLNAAGVYSNFKSKTTLESCIC